MKLFPNLCLFFLFCIVSSKTFSQHYISIGPQIGIASRFSGSTKIGVGGSFEYAKKFSQHLGGGVSLGYTSFKSTHYSYSETISFLPLRIGLQGYMSQATFLSVDAGAAILNDRYTKGRSGLSYSVGASQQFFLNSHSNFIQLSANYNGFQYDAGYKHNWFNLRVAYGLIWGKSNHD